MKTILLLFMFAMVAIKFEKVLSRYLLVKIDEGKGKEFDSDQEEYQSRILDGVTSSPINLRGHAQGSKPYLVFLWDVRARYGSQGGIVCTGVIIGRRHILTAMHCLDNRRENTLSRWAYDEKIQNRRIYFGIYDARQRSQADALPNVHPTQRPVSRLPKSIKGLVASDCCRETGFWCNNFGSCSFSPTVLYKKATEGNTGTNLFAGRGFESYNVDRNLIDLALVEVESVESVDFYEYRQGNAVNDVFRPLKAAEIDRVQSPSNNNCNTCTGDCSEGKVFNAQGWGRYGSALVSSNRPRWMSMKCTQNCRTKTGNDNKCARFANANDKRYGWMKKFCVISSVNPSNPEKTTCEGDSGSPLTRAAEELRYSNYQRNAPISDSVFVVTGILTGQACERTSCSPDSPHLDASAYVNLKDQTIRTFLSNEVSDLNLFRP